MTIGHDRGPVIDGFSPILVTWLSTYGTLVRQTGYDIDSTKLLIPLLRTIPHLPNHKDRGWYFGIGRDGEQNLVADLIVEAGI